MPYPTFRVVSTDDSASEDQLQLVPPAQDAPVSELDLPSDSRGFFFLHLRLLLWKNYKLFTRSLKMTLFQLVTPIFFCLLIVYLQWLADGYTSLSMPNPSSEVGPMKHCIGEDCVTVGFGIIVSRSDGLSIF